jgi:hypothetical protein
LLGSEAVILGGGGGGVIVSLEIYPV